MATRVWHFLRKNKGVTAAKRLKESDVPALGRLPPFIKEDLRLEIYMPILSVHPFFFALHLREETLMLKICNLAISDKTLATGEELFRDCIRCVKKMLFVVSGTLQYIELTPEQLESGQAEKPGTVRPAAAPVKTEKGNEEGKEGEKDIEHFVRAGQWACEVALWAEVATLNGPFVATGGAADIILIDADQFMQVIRLNDSSLDFLTKYGEYFMDAFRDLVSDFLDEDPLFDTSEVNVLFNELPHANDLVREAEEETDGAFTRHFGGSSRGKSFFGGTATTRGSSRV